MLISVYVRSVIQTEKGGAVIEASNGSDLGPPFVRWQVPLMDAKNIHLGQRFNVEIKPAD